MHWKVIISWLKKIWTYFIVQYQNGMKLLEKTILFFEALEKKWPGMSGRPGTIEKYQKYHNEI